MPRLTLLLVLSVTVTAARARAAPVLAGRIERVVAAGEGVAALRGGEALLVDGGGRVVGRCDGARAAAGRTRRADGTTIPADRLLRESGFREDDDSPEAEALLDDEGIDPRRRRAPIDAAAGMPRAVDLAAGDGAAWIGTADGLWRLDVSSGGCARAGLRGRAVDLVAAAAGTVVAVAGSTVWRSADGGASFAVAAVLSARARAVALTGDGVTAFVATDDAVVGVTAPRRPVPVLQRPADALVTCGPHVLALADDGTYRLDTDGLVDRLGERPAVRSIACGGPSRLVAGGVGLWTTSDGRAWTEEHAFLGRSIAAVAFAGGRTWLALDGDGLVTFPSLDGEGGPAENVPLPRLARASPLLPPSWAWLLPRVAISFDGWTESRARAGWRLWLVLTVSLDRRRAAGGVVPGPEVPLQ